MPQQWINNGYFAWITSLKTWIILTAKLALNNEATLRCQTQSSPKLPVEQHRIHGSLSTPKLRTKQITGEIVHNCPHGLLSAGSCIMLDPKATCWSWAHHLDLHWTDAERLNLRATSKITYWSCCSNYLTMPQKVRIQSSYTEKLDNNPHQMQGLPSWLIAELLCGKSHHELF
jgi:hypothetical protein